MLTAGIGHVDSAWWTYRHASVCTTTTVPDIMSRMVGNFIKEETLNKKIHFGDSLNLTSRQSDFS